MLRGDAVAAATRQAMASPGGCRLYRTKACICDEGEGV